jgi:hypothetical protein
MEHMKARWPTRCEHCKEWIEVGSRITMFAGRPWLTTHLVDYQRQRQRQRRT